MSSKKHKWIMLATFSVPEETIGKLAKARLHVSKSLDEEPPKVGMDLSQDRLLTVDGPGCAECSVEWTAGHGQPCPGRPTL